MEMEDGAGKTIGCLLLGTNKTRKKKPKNYTDMTICGTQIDQVPTMHYHNYHPQWQKCIEHSLT